MSKSTPSFPSFYDLLFFLRKPQENNVQVYIPSSLPTTNTWELFISSFGGQSISRHVALWDSISQENITQLKVSFSPPPFSSTLNNLEKDSYIKLLEKTIDTIRSTELKKVIISRTKTVPFSIKNVLKLYQKLCFEYPNAYVYLLQAPDNKLWIGASPELLLKINDSALETISLAGSKATEEDSWTQKEYDEQAMVTEYISSVLSKYCNNIQKTGPTTVKSGTVYHLHTKISGEVTDRDQVNMLIKDLNPTPAVCGIPRDNAAKFILENESHDRELYTGYIGLKKHRDIELFVNLRCAQITLDKITLYIGGGITDQSTPEMEWIETEVKAKTILNHI